MQTESPVATIWRRRDVCRELGLSPSSIYRLEATNDFPRRVQLSARAVGWPAEAVLKWAKQRPEVK